MENQVHQSQVMAAEIAQGVYYHKSSSTMILAPYHCFAHPDFPQPHENAEFEEVVSDLLRGCWKALQELCYPVKTILIDLEPTEYEPTEGGAK